MSRNSLLVKDDMPVLWAHPWIDDINCVVLPYQNERKDICNRPSVNEELAMPKLYSLLHNPDKMYDLYLRCVDHSHKYRLPNYFINHVIPSIMRAINGE